MFSVIAFIEAGKLTANRPFSAEAFKVFYQSLDIMWKGMAGIFVVIAAFFIIVKLLGRMSAKE